jgi:hypothetical protein
MYVFFVCVREARILRELDFCRGNRGKEREKEEAVEEF